ncbi:MAG: Nif3-like dinuclear metal center hexameric protein, partial [Patescibacteria group bacterium]
GTGRFTPGPGANPTLGIVGKPEQVEEERIEVTVDAAALDDVVAAIKKAHPYEEVPIDIYELK